MDSLIPKSFCSLKTLRIRRGGGGEGWVTPDNGPYGEVLPGRATLFRMKGYKRGGISQAKVYIEKVHLGI